MDIKATKKILVSGNAHPVKIGDVVKGVDDAEAKALVSMGYAVEVKSKGNAPENKGKSEADESNPFAAVLAGSVAEITARLDTFSADELRTLRDLEAAGQNRKGVADAIGQYDLGE